jgi:hypothetical protein
MGKVARIRQSRIAFFVGIKRQSAKSVSPVSV